MEMSRLKPCGSDTYARPPRTALEALKMFRGEPVIETVFPALAEAIEILAEPGPAANCAQRAAWGRRSLG